MMNFVLAGFFVQICVRYFKHFYWLAMLQISAVILTLLHILILHNKPPALLKSYINLVAPHKTDGHSGNHFIFYFLIYRNELN